MIIKTIDIYRIGIPFSVGSRATSQVAEHDTFNAAAPNISVMESLMVRLTTDTGLEGWGEAFGHGLNPVTFVALEALAGPFFLGTRVEEHGRTLTSARRAFHSFGQSGPMLYALSAIDTALWDLAAQEAGLPLYAFLGAEPRELELYASLVSYQNKADDIVHAVGCVQQLGFQRIKLHETQPAAIAAARAALPPEIELMVDTNCPWPAAEALDKARQLKALGLSWLEEPVWPPDDLSGLAAVRQAGVPLAAGENVSGVEGFRQLFHAGAVDVAQPSVAKIGGVSGMLEVFRLAREFDLCVVPHCFYYGPGMLATAHLVVTLPARIALEVPFVQLEHPLHPLLDFPPRLWLSEAPGLGFRPDEQALSRYLIDRATLSDTSGSAAPH